MNIYTLHTWHDIIEILFFSYLFYRITLWLSYDKKNNLLPMFYGTCAVAVGAHFVELTTMSTFLLLFSPVMITLFILMHQETLQRNIVATKHTTITTPPIAHDWLSLLMRHVLKQLTNNKSLLILIEHTDDLTPFIHTDYPLNNKIDSGMLALLSDHPLTPSDSMLWIKSDGSLRGIQCKWKASWHPEQYQNQTAWIDDAIAYSTKTDALILYSDFKNHRCSLAHSGTIYNNLTIEQASHAIKKEINYPLTVTQKGYDHGSAAGKKNRMAQHSS